ncbi:hypothetical protein [Roseateles sp. LYH14W]|uniref:Uncharacterized protein n=1 Tax=Pelomonas parva TaxID=3299032 RepID=A0ABW7F3L7_9BURK
MDDDVGNIVARMTRLENRDMWVHTASDGRCWPVDIAGLQR